MFAFSGLTHEQRGVTTFDAQLVAQMHMFVLQILPYCKIISFSIGLNKKWAQIGDVLLFFSSSSILILEGSCVV